MATNNLETDLWVEGADPISNLETDQYNFALTAHPSFSLKTDLWVPYFYQLVASDLTPQIIFMVGSDPAGDVQLINVGKSDDSTTIFYELETQDLEFNNRAINKAITDKLGIATQNAHDSEMQIIADDKDPKNIPIDMGKRVNITSNLNIKGHYARLRWSGEAKEKAPILEGFYLNKIKDDGINNNG